MSDALPEDLWINSFLASQPRPLQANLQKRLHTSTNHLNSLAEIYKQRAAIEAHYADSLAKLVRSAEQGNLLPKSPGIDWDKSSGEGKLWDSVISEISQTSSSHSTLAAILRTDFEQPLRELPSKIVPWRRIADQDASLEKALKDYEKTSAKLEKASSKSKSNKADQLAHELNEITSSLASLSPMVYTTYQRLDEERLRSLKELVIRWGTVRADMAQKDGERAERVVALIISWETQDEVAAVGRRLGGGGRGTASNAPTLGSTIHQQSDRRASNATPTNDFSPQPIHRQGTPGSPANPPPTSFAGGLKSMLGRKSTLGTGRGRSGSYATSTRSANVDREDVIEEQEGRIPTGPPVDEHGFSIAPADRHRSPWDEPDESIPTPTLAPEPAGPASTTTFDQNFTSSPTRSTENLAAPISPQGTSTQPKLNLAIAPAPIQESEEERLAALQKMQQTLQSQPPQQPSRRQTIARGRRDVRNTVFGMPSETANGGNGAALSGSVSPVSNGDSPNDLSRGPAPNRQASTISTSSSNPFDSPGLSGGLHSAFGQDSGAGLRANMVETISTITRNGEVERLQINGEIHLSLRGMTSAPGPIHIRLSEFERLEKIAPNPAYLAQVPEKPGEYFLNAEVLASATANASSKGVLLFRYQVHIPPGQERASLPLILEPAFRCGDGETRMILKYNSNGTLGVNQLSNVTLAATFGPGPSVSNVQAKPAGGVWSPNSRRMTWSLGEAGREGKIIAKFTNEPGTTLAPLGVQASWAIEGHLSSGIGLSVVPGELETDLTFSDIKKATTNGKYMAEPIAQ